MYYPRLLSIIFALTIFCASSAQTVQDSVAVHFRQSKVDLDSAYMDNHEAYEHIRQAIKEYHHPDSNFVLLNVNVIGAASPEGSVKFNQWLSKQRAIRIYDFIGRYMELPDSLTEHTFLGRDWRGLRSMVAADSNVPARKDVLALLDDIIEKYDRGETESDDNLLHLKQLQGGVPYLYMYYNIFPYLRQANVVLTFGTPAPKIKRLDMAPLWLDIDLPAPSIYNIPIPQPDKPFYMALKSNIIADALCLPEIGAEFYLGKNLSIVGNWMYGWWDKDSIHRYWRAYGGDIALRWWFGKAAHRKPLTGQHIGVYGGVVTYDFEFGGRGYMGGYPGRNLWYRCMHYCGVEYGYSLPIARRWNIDFTLGLGYMGGKYIEYVPKGSFYCWESTNRKHYFGPTKLEVSLVWLIGHGNFNKKGAKL